MGVCEQQKAYLVEAEDSIRLDDGRVLVDHSCPSGGRARRSKGDEKRASASARSRPNDPRATPWPLTHIRQEEVNASRVIPATSRHLSFVRLATHPLLTTPSTATSLSFVLVQTRALRHCPLPPRQANHVPCSGHHATTLTTPQAWRRTCRDILFSKRADRERRRVFSLGAAER